MLQPIIYSQEFHNIDQNLIDSEALHVIEKLHQAGYLAYLVGGSVRDLLSSFTPKDFDVSTNARPEEVKKVFGRKCIVIGRRFRLAHVRFGKKTIEVSTFRRKNSDEGELIVQDNAWGTPEEDALRRDFTLNALFYNPIDQTLIDYVGGLEDLGKKILVAIGDPFTRFREDPVRMIRLLKFKARFNYQIEEKTEKALEELKEEITKSSEARILEELLRMLESGSSSKFFKLLEQTGLLALVLPPMDAFIKTSHAEEIFTFLDKADQIQNQYGKHALDRPVLASCLLFPALNEEVKTLITDDEKAPHLGEIMMLAQNLTHTVVSRSFSRFPKRLSTLINQVMVDQYRLTPLGNRKGTKSRFIESREFSQALKFLKLRAMIDPSLREPYCRWMDCFKERVHRSDRTPRPHNWHHPKKVRRRT